MSKKKTTLIIALLVAVIIILCAIIIFIGIVPKNKNNNDNTKNLPQEQQEQTDSQQKSNDVSSEDNEKTEESTADQEELSNEANYLRAISLYEQGSLGEARSIFYSLGSYKDSADYYHSIQSLPQTKITTSSSSKTIFNYFYNENGVVDKIEEIDGVNEHDFFRTTTYVLDSKNNPTMEYIVCKIDSSGFEDESYIWHENKYDDNGKIKEQVVTAYGSKTKFSYIDGVLIDEFGTNESGYSYEIIYFPDTNFNIKSEMKYAYNGNHKELLYAYSYEYDENGRRIRSYSETDKNECCYEYETEYNQCGDITKEVCTSTESSGGTTVTTQEYLYNDNGDLIRYVYSYNAYGSKTSCTEEYSSFCYFLNK